VFGGEMSDACEFEAHMQASENMSSALIRFIALCTAEPADESGWLRIVEVFEKK
jgi:hypothetical protein